jgi:hypothetical protein
MKTSRIFVIVIVITMGLPPRLAAQSLQTPSAPSYSAPSSPGTEQTQAQGQASQLILWSQAEKPKPAPIPFPRAKSADRPRSPYSSPPQKRIMSGTIERSGKRYILRMSNFSASQSRAVIQLDDQQSASRFEGRQVKLTGTFDQASNFVQVDTIELIS